MLETRKEKVADYINSKLEEFEINKTEFGNLTGIPSSYFSCLKPFKFDKVPLAVWDYLTDIYDENKFAKVLTEEYPKCKGINYRPRRIESAKPKLKQNIVEKRKEELNEQHSKGIDKGTGSELVNTFAELESVLKRLKTADIKVRIEIEI